jgi:diaminopimelate decarboxylase
LALFDSLFITDLVQEFGTPLYAYNKSTIEKRIKDLKPLGTIRYAQKALPNLAILTLMKNWDVVVDAVSAGELYRALHVGFKGNSSPSGVVYTADILDEDGIHLIKDHQVPINAGSADVVLQTDELGLRVPLILRINPGFGHGHSQKVNTGGELSKHGVWHEELPELLTKMKSLGLPLYGLHMHIGSGTDLEHLQKVAIAMVDAFQTCHRIFGDLPDFRVISAGGGFPIPYTSDAPRIDLDAYQEIWRIHRAQIEKSLCRSINFEVEPGRYLVAESGVIITKIRAKKFMGSYLFYLLDAGFDTLVRPAMYGAYHNISVVPARGRTLGAIRPAVVAGPLCESGDVFTQVEGGIVVTRDLPEAQVGDYVVLHDTGAYGSSMASQYNSRLLAAEVLVTNGQTKLIRRRQRLEEILMLEI